MSKHLCWGMAVLFLAACTMIPKYERPTAPISQSWPTGPAYQTNAPVSTGTNGAKASDISWRSFFTDARLQRLMETALTNNLDLRTAMLNVEAVRAQYRIQSSELLPNVTANGAYTRQRIPTGNIVTGGGGSSGFTFSRYNVNLAMASYEVDLFGRIRSLKLQALERFLATQEAQLSAQMVLLSEIANQYYLERELDELLVLTQNTLESVSSYNKIINTSYEYGNASEIDVSTARAQIETARANVANFIRQRAQAENALVQLLGGALPSDLPSPRPLGETGLIADLPAGLPSDLLAQRPDIRAAEFQLKAANANIGAARAAFFPRIMLTGAAGYSSTELQDLFTPGSRSWGFTPQLTIPIFEMAYNKANLDLTKIQKRIEIVHYQQAIQNAFREVSDALAGRTTYVSEIEAERALVQAEQRRYDLADIRYRNGVDSYLSVLVAQQDLYASQERLIQSRYLEIANLVNLYKALGGGWK